MTETDPLLELHLTVRDALKAQKRMALWQNAVITSLAKLHLATSDVLHLSRRIQHLALLDDLSERVALSKEIDRESRRIFDALMKSMEELRDTETAPAIGVDHDGT